MSIKYVLVLWAVSMAALPGCHKSAQAGHQESAPVAAASDVAEKTADQPSLAPTGEATINEGDAKVESQPNDSALATEFFKLVDKDTCGANCPEHNAKMAAELGKLLPADKTTPSLRKRLFSGPQPKGERVKLGAQDVWIYKACQAHQCSTTNLVVAYNEQDQRMVARLQSRCEVSWLGGPLPEEQSLIDAKAPIDLKDENRTFDCPKE